MELKEIIIACVGFGGFVLGVVQFYLNQRVDTLEKRVDEHKTDFRREVDQCQARCKEHRGDC